MIDCVPGSPGTKCLPSSKMWSARSSVESLERGTANASGSANRSILAGHGAGSTSKWWDAVPVWPYAGGGQPRSHLGTKPGEAGRYKEWGSCHPDRPPKPSGLHR